MHLLDCDPSPMQSPLHPSRYVHKPKDTDKDEYFTEHLVYIVVRDIMCEAGAGGEGRVYGTVEDRCGGDGGGEQHLDGDDAVELADEPLPEVVLAEGQPRVERPGLDDASTRSYPYIIFDALSSSSPIV
ncbi:hypothetical protein B296_00058918 [Ensete ventricosum]|uniref:Uncharacterized protein n=1 Tax=Ensete ventricosum TaxID=4639 RepID=A0A426WZT7_ENSVE|nr:hypothetical protein B296_00058918 [Ensete ventricosum]